MCPDDLDGFGQPGDAGVDLGVGLHRAPGVSGRKPDPGGIKDDTPDDHAGRGILVEDHVEALPVEQVGAVVTGIACGKGDLLENVVVLLGELGAGLVGGCGDAACIGGCRARERRLERAEQAVEIGGQGRQDRGGRCPLQAQRAHGRVVDDQAATGVDRGVHVALARGGIVVGRIGVDRRHQVLRCVDARRCAGKRECHGGRGHDRVGRHGKGDAHLVACPQRTRRGCRVEQVRIGVEVDRAAVGEIHAGAKLGVGGARVQGSAQAGLHLLDHAGDRLQAIVGGLDGLDAEAHVVEQAGEVLAPHRQPFGLEIVQRIIERRIDLASGRQAHLRLVLKGRGVLERQQVAADAF